MRELNDAAAHIEEAYKLLSGEAYRGTGPENMVQVEGFCTIVADLERIDSAIGPAGESVFAMIADTINAAYVEIKAARAALQRPE